MTNGKSRVCTCNSLAEVRKSIFKCLWSAPYWRHRYPNRAPSKNMKTVWCKTVHRLSVRTIPASRHTPKMYRTYTGGEAIEPGSAIETYQSQPAINTQAYNLIVTLKTILVLLCPVLTSTGKVRLSPKTARQRRNSATVALFCDKLSHFSATVWTGFMSFGWPHMITCSHRKRPA